MKKIIYLFSAIVLLTSCGNPESENKNNNENEIVAKGAPKHGAKSSLSLEGVEIPSSITIDSTTLILNGAGVRNKFHLKVYVAALYLPSKSSVPVDIINKDETQLVVVHITSILMTSSSMTKYISEGFVRSTGGKTASIQKEIDQAMTMFNSSPVEKNDKFEIFYLPNEKGIKAFKNGKFLYFVPCGMEFKKAIFGIWLSNDPVDEGLKTGMLGLKEE
jgi:Chalcone isomerase-like